MSDRYQNILNTAYDTFLNTCVIYPAIGKDAKPVLQDAQKQKIANLVNAATSSLNTTLAACGQVIAKAQGGQYVTKAALETDAKRNTTLLKAQAQALAALFAGFKREEDAWIKQAATLSQDARSAAVKAQRAVAAAFVAAVQDIETSVDADLKAAIQDWTSGTKPTPAPTPTPAAADLDVQRGALEDAALDGALFVAIDPALKSAAQARA